MFSSVAALTPEEASFHPFCSCHLITSPFVSGFILCLFLKTLISIQPFWIHERPKPSIRGGEKKQNKKNGCRISITIVSIWLLHNTQPFQSDFHTQNCAAMDLLTFLTRPQIFSCIHAVRFPDKKNKNSIVKEFWGHDWWSWHADIISGWVGFTTTKSDW